VDVTNPGLVSVASETYGNPDPNGGQARWAPREDGSLDQVAGEGYPAPPGAGASGTAFPTPDDVLVDQLLAILPVISTPTPDASEVYVDEQSLGQGSMQPVDPGDLAAGYAFVAPADFIVVGPAESFQTNASEEDERLVVVSQVLDADRLPAPAGPATTRFYLVVVTPPALTALPVSLLGREIVFADDCPTIANRGAARIITGYGANFVVVDRSDPFVANGDVPELDVPQAGDSFWVSVARQGAEQVSTSGETVNVFISPPPPVAQSESADSFGLVNAFVSTGPQPAYPEIGSGVEIPNTRNVSVPDSCQVVGLPVNVYT
jgi:hypothetical protein